MFTPQGDYGSWRVARSLAVLCQELNEWDKNWTCLGLIGDQRHQAQNAYSDHNPIVKDPQTGQGIVRAIDIVCSTPAKQQDLRDHLNKMYGQRDPRVYYYGYMHMDNQVTVWGGNGETHYNEGDVGHLHVSLTQSSYPSVPGGYVKAIDSTAPWGLVEKEFTMDKEARAAFAAVNTRLDAIEAQQTKDHRLIVSIRNKFRDSTNLELHRLDVLVDHVVHGISWGKANPLDIVAKRMRDRRAARK